MSLLLPLALVYPCSQEITLASPPLHPSQLWWEAWKEETLNQFCQQSNTTSHEVDELPSSSPASQATRNKGR